MNKKIIGILMCGVLLLTILPVAQAVEMNPLEKLDEQVEDVIEETGSLDKKGKTFVFGKIMFYRERKMYSIFRAVRLRYFTIGTGDRGVITHTTVISPHKLLQPPGDHFTGFMRGGFVCGVFDGNLIYRENNLKDLTRDIFKYFFNGII